MNQAWAGVAVAWKSFVPVRARDVARDLIHQSLHHVPAVLLLSVAAAALLTSKPDWLRSLDAALMTEVDRVGRKLTNLFPSRGSDELKKTFELQQQEWARSITVLALAPAAHKEWLRGTSPLPRDGMACVVQQLANWIADGKLKRRQYGIGRTGWRPVVALDFDVAPIEAASGNPQAQPAPWDSESAEGFCVPQQAPNGLDGRVGFKCGSIATTDDAMQCALARLADEALVLAIVYPRTTEQGRERRNHFIQRTCACTGNDCPTRDSTSAEGRVIYASPHLGVATGERVFEFPDRTKGPQTNDLMQFPGLGTALAKVILRAKPVSGQEPKDVNALIAGESSRPPDPLLTHYCAQVHRNPAGPLLDDELAVLGQSGDILQRYHYRGIGMGRVRSQVATADIFPSTAAGNRKDQPVEPVSLSNDIRASLAAVEPSDDVYLLTVDTGTTDDRFAVPVFEHPVPGGWIHAAIALTLLDETTGQPAATEPQNDAAARASMFGKKFWHEFELGVQVVLLATLLKMLQRRLWDVDRQLFPVLRSVLDTAIPAIAVMVVATYELLAVDAQYRIGVWTNPLPFLLAMLVHFHVDAVAAKGQAAVATSVAAPSQCPPLAPTTVHKVSPADRAVRALLQWAWALPISCAFVYWLGHFLEQWPGWPSGLLLSAAVAGGFVYFARRVAWLPLAWRPDH